MGDSRLGRRGELDGRGRCSGLVGDLRTPWGTRLACLGAPCGGPVLTRSCHTILLGDGGPDDGLQNTRLGAQVRLPFPYTTYGRMRPRARVPSRL
jgi:hypothetical protein